MAERFYTILSSAPNLVMIQQAITDFYCGSVKTLRPGSCPQLWDVLNADGKPLDRVHVRKKRGRYLFVTTG